VEFCSLTIQVETYNVKFLINTFFFCDLQTDASSKAIFSKVMVITSKLKYLHLLKITVEMSCFCFKNNLR